MYSQDAAEDAAAPVVAGADAVKGKELFNANCAACHKLDAKATGPALRGVAAKYDKEWLYKWIKNSGELIKSGDALAIKVYEENNKVAMTAFPQLSNEDIDNIIAYTSEPKPEAPVAVPGAAVAEGVTADSGISNNIILGALVVVLGMLVVMLFLVSNVLNKIAKKHDASIQQVVLRWLFQRGIFTIPKSVTPERINSNFQSGNLKLSLSEMESINGLNKARRYYGDPDNFNF